MGVQQLGPSYEAAQKQFQDVPEASEEWIVMVAGMHQARVSEALVGLHSGRPAGSDKPRSMSKRSGQVTTQLASLLA
jgi:hypothetical protein